MRAVSASMLAVLLAAVPLAGGCSKKPKQGLPPAESWDQNSGGGAAAALDEAQRPRSSGERSSHPHAGGPGAPPLDDDGGGGDPHAGMDMGGGGGGDPHAGLDMGGGGGGIDVTQLGLPPPDPARKIDPSRRVAGTLRATPATRARLKAGGAVFLVVRRAGSDGQPTGGPLAVEKLMWSGDAIPFELTEANAMSAGTELSGDVVVMARYDQDSDAITKQPGDVAGQARAKVPADRLDVALDTILP